MNPLLLYRRPVCADDQDNVGKAELSSGTLPPYPLHGQVAELLTVVGVECRLSVPGGGMKRAFRCVVRE